VTGWRVATSLLTLRAQIDALYPGRDTASDGAIGDAAHRQTTSDHNPDARGVVCALDITNDPAHGCSIDALSDALQLARDPRLAYVIANGLIMSGADGPSPWIWRPYGGNDPHTGHMHVSVVHDAQSDNPARWDLTHLGIAEGDDMAGQDADWAASHVPAPDGTGEVGMHVAVGAIWRDVEDLKTRAAAPAPALDYRQLAAALIEELLGRG